ncbi:MAG: hypothetical protein IT384_10125 [Deltaproteobacteria bacterium]|nr:hypothetical protein [Deltaproteobacteria bacterium]
MAQVYAACAVSYQARNPLHERFPSVRGKSLSGTEVELPRHFSGEPTLLLIAYEQRAQFDLDRWLLALSEAGVRTPIYEVPTIPGVLPGLFASRIDEGMRSGIPSEDWASVVTVYEDGEAIAAFTGNERRSTGRVVLIDARGVVRFFHDEGFSVRALNGLRRAIEDSSAPARTMADARGES